ncbi:MAG: hypothetical protein ACRC37_02300, partial [Lentisphaeria bacterium]
LHQQKIAAAKSPDTKNLCSQIWVEIKKLEAEKLEAVLLKIVDLIQITNLDYWNSRGALLPWAIAAGGENFYQKVVNESMIIND